MQPSKAVVYSDSFREQRIPKRSQRSTFGQEDTDLNEVTGNIERYQDSEED